MIGREKNKYIKLKFCIFLVLIGLALFVLFENRHAIMNIKIEQVLNFIEKEAHFHHLYI